MLDDVADAAQELMHGHDYPSDPPSSPAANSPLAEQEDHPPEMFDISDRLPTIEEGDEEHGSDTLMPEAWFEELTRINVLEDNPEHGDVPPTSAHKMPYQTVMFSCKAEHNDEPVMHRHVHTSLLATDCIVQVPIYDDEDGENCPDED